MFAIVLTATFGSACASLNHGAPQIRGTSGPVAWEIVDIRERLAPDGKEIRWYYTVVLKETAARGIQFEKAEWGSRGQETSGNVGAQAFQRRLEPNGELRLDYSHYIYTTGTPQFGRLPGGQYGVTVFRRYHGRDDAGTSVTVNVLIPLAPGVGKRME